MVQWENIGTNVAMSTLATKHPVCVRVKGLDFILYAPGNQWPYDHFYKWMCIDVWAMLDILKF